jgi:uncharacterized protein
LQAEVSTIHEVIPAMALFDRYLIVKKSKLPEAGNGLFTTIDIPKGKRITEYKGRLQRWTDVKDQDGFNGYLLRVHRSWAINALKSLKTFGRYANDANGISRNKVIRNNAEYITYGLRCYLESTRDIKKGEEILVAYGSDYWKLIRKIERQR